MLPPEPSDLLHHRGCLGDQLVGLPGVVAGRMIESQNDASEGLSTAFRACSTTTRSKLCVRSAKAILDKTREPSTGQSDALRARIVASRRRTRGEGDGEPGGRLAQLG